MIRPPAPCAHFAGAERACRSTYDCADCGKSVCSGCYVAEVGCCEPCADEYLLSADALHELMVEWPGLTAGDLAERARTAALTARFNQGNPKRYVPDAWWYVERVRVVLRDMHRMNLTVCNLSHRRVADHTAFCCWSAVKVSRASA